MKKKKKKIKRENKSSQQDSIPGCPTGVKLGTLRYGDYGLQTTGGKKIRTGTRHMCFRIPPSQAHDGA